MTKRAGDLRYKNGFLVLIGIFDGGEHLERMARLIGRANKRLHILWKARAPIAAACIQKPIANAGVRTDPPAHLLNIGPERLCKIRKLIHKRNTGGKHGIGRVLGELGRAYIHDHKLVVVALKRCVDGSHYLHRPWMVGTNNNAVGPLKVLDRGTLFKEFRVGDNMKRDAS